MRILLISLFSLLGLSTITAQDAEFSVTVSADSILIGNYFQVTFSIENGDAKNFEPPSFQGFAIVGGPNQSSSFSMMNGTTTQSLSYSYYLAPKEEGQFFIEPANVEIGGKIFETEPLEIKVAPNPEGIIQNPQRQQRSFDSFFDFPAPFNKEEKKKKTKPKKKRKTYRI